MAKNGRAGMHMNMRRRNATVRAIFGGALGLLAASVAACTTGSVLSLEPAVDVGSSTASVPRIEQPAPRVEMAAISTRGAGSS